MSDTTLHDTLRGCTPEEIVNALKSLDSERPGLAYDVGLGLIDTDANKEFPGPAWNWCPDLDSGEDIYLESYDAARKLETLVELRKLTRWSVAMVNGILKRVDAGVLFGVVVGVSSDVASNAKTRLEAVGCIVHLVTHGEKTPTSHIRSLKGLFAGPVG